MKSQHPIRLIPREGAAHPVFRDLRDDQALELFLLYQQLLQPEADSFAQQQAAITQWHATLHQRLTQLLGADPDYLWETNPAVMRLVIPRQPRPQATTRVPTSRAPALAQRRAAYECAPAAPPLGTGIIGGGPTYGDGPGRCQPGPPGPPGPPVS